MIGNTDVADDLLHILLAVGRDESFAAGGSAQRKRHAQRRYRYLLDCVSVLHKTAPIFYRTLPVPQKCRIFPWGYVSTTYIITDSAQMCKCFSL